MSIKRFTAMVLAVLMVVTMLPVSAFADALSASRGGVSEGLGDIFSGWGTGYSDVDTGNDPSLAAAGDGTGEDEITQEDPVITGDYQVYVGASVSITGTSANYSHSWSSGNTSVATVSGSSKTGSVTGKANGTVTITHTYKNSRTGTQYTETFDVTVIGPTISIEESAEIEPGETYTISGTYGPKTMPNQYTTVKVSWKSSNTKVATVDSNGVVTAVGEGTATITATNTYNYKTKSSGSGTNYTATDTCAVTVSTNLAGIDASFDHEEDGKYYLYYNQDGTATAELSFKSEDGKKDYPITWTKNGNITLDTTSGDTVKVTATADTGTATLTAKAGSKTKTITIELRKPAYFVLPETLDLAVGEASTITADCQQTEIGMSGASVEWVVDNGSICTAVKDGDFTAAVTGSMPGSAKVYAKVTYGGKTYTSNTCAVTVRNITDFGYTQTTRVQSGKVRQAEETMYEGDTCTFIAAYDLKETAPEAPSITYAAGNEFVSVTDNGDGTATVAALAIGSGSVKASSELMSANVDITVVSNVAAIRASYKNEKGIPSGEVLYGKTGTATASLTFAKNNAKKDYPITWSVKSGDVTLASTEGETVSFTAGTTGETAVLVAKAGDVEQELTVSLKAPVFTIDPVVTGVNIGATEHVYLGSSDLDVSEELTAIEWITGDTSVATAAPNQNGDQIADVKGVAIGETTLYAKITYAGGEFVSPVCTVSVTPNITGFGYTQTIVAHDPKASEVTEELPEGGTYEFHAFYDLKPDSSATPAITYAEGNEYVSVSDIGGGSATVKALALGTADVISACENLTAVAHITVISNIKAVTIPGSMTVYKGSRDRIDVDKYVEYVDENAKHVGGADGYECYFYSEDASIVAIDGNGELTPLSEGTATVHVVIDGVDYPISVTVKQSFSGFTAQKEMELDASASPKSGDLTKSMLVSYYNEQGTLQTVSYDEFMALGKQVVFSFTSDDPSVAYVDDKGVVSAVSKGFATVSIEADGQVANVLVTVYDNGEAPEPDPDKLYSVTIHYIFSEDCEKAGQEAASSWNGRFLEGSSVELNVTSPANVAGYVPDIPVYTENIEFLTGPIERTVYYYPGTNHFTVEYWLQTAEGGENYELSETVQVPARTEDKISTYRFEKSFDNYIRLSYDRGAKVAADGSTTVEIYYQRKSFLITFDLNGGTGVSPVYNVFGHAFTFGTPTRVGYEFEGWYADKDLTQKVTETTGTIPTRNVTYYAKWTPKTAKYLVIHWQEKVNSQDPTDYANNYDFKESEEKTGISDGLTAATAKTYTGFSAPAEIPKLIIKGDGTTVVNLYYPRASYTFTFKNGNTTIHTFTAKAGSFIGDKWTFKGSDGYQYPRTDTGTVTSWTPSGSKIYTQRLMQLDTMPAENITWKYTTSSNGKKYFEYYVSSLEGTTGERTYDGTQYDLYLAFENDYNQYYAADDFFEINGFTRKAATKASSKTGTESSLAMSGSASMTNGYYYRFYYTRNKYDLVFINRTSTYRTDKVEYQAPLTNKNYQLTEADRPAEVPEGYVFVGWYKDPECSGRETFKFDSETMPAANLSVYAKWAPIEVTLTVESSNIDNASHSLSFSIPKGSAFTDKYTVEDSWTEVADGDMREFVGWFYKDNNEPFSFTMPIVKDTTVYAKFRNDNTADIVIHYIDEAGNTIEADTFDGGNEGDKKYYEAKTIDNYYPYTNSHSINMNQRSDDGTIYIPAHDGEDAVYEYSFVYKYAPYTDYTVLYLSKADGLPLLPDKEVHTDLRIVMEIAASIEGYRPTERQKTLVLTADKTQNVIIFYYEDASHATTAPVEIYHWKQDPTTGEFQANYFAYARHEEEQVGAVYDYEPDVMDVTGYTFDDTKTTFDPGKKGDALTAEGLTVNLYYVCNEYPYTFYYKNSKGEKEELADAVTGTARYTSAVEGTAKTIPGYTLVSADKLTVTIKADTTGEKNAATFWYTENSVNITYVAETGGTVSSSSDANIEVFTGDPKGSAATAKTGYKFLGWFTKKDGVYTQVSPDAFFKPGPTGKIGEKDCFLEETYYARFEMIPADYTVEHYLENLDGTFGTEEGKPNFSDTKTAGVGSEVTAAKRKDAGFTFSAELSNITGTVLEDGSLTLKLYYTRSLHTVTYEYEGTVPEEASELPGVATYKYGASVTVAPDATATGYTFSGWDAEDFTMPDEDVVIKGSFTINSYPLTINYVDEDGEPLAEAYTDTLDYRAAYNRESPAITGYTLKDSAQATVSGTMPAKELTVDVVYTINSYDLTVNYVDEQGNVVAPQHTESLNYKAEYDVDSPAVEGYTVTPGQENVSGTMPADNVTETVVYTINSHKVTYKYEGTVPAGAPELPAEATYNYNADVDVAKVPTLEGYTFHGWNKNGEEVTSFRMPDEDVELIGSWTRNEADLTVHYEYTDGTEAAEDHTETLPIGTEYNVTSPVIPGYTADKTAVTGTLEEDTEVTVVYTVNKYNVIYMITGDYFTDDAYHVDADVPFGTALTLITDDMTKTGYKFSGWTGLPLLMPDNIVIVTGSYTINSYDLTVNYKYADGTPAAESYTDTVVYNTEYSVTSPVITGYTADKTVVSGTMPAQNVTVDVVYTANSYPYTVHYYWNGTTESVAEDKTGADTVFGTSVTESPITVTGCTAVSDASKTITIATEGNEIIFYYYKDATLTANSKTDCIYDGTEKTVSGYTCDVTSAEFTGITATRTETAAGTYEVNFSEGAVGTVSTDAKYIVSAVEPGTLTISKAEIAVTVTAEDISVTYDGAEHTATEVTFSSESSLFNEEDVIYTAKAQKSTDVIEKTAIGYSEADFSYANKNIEVTFNVTDGSLEIVPAEYGIKTESATKTYDGEPLTNEEASVIGLIGTETATVSGTGTITEVGNTENTYGEVTWDTAKASNYTHNTALDELGTLTVAIAAIEVTVTAEDISVTYDGSEHTATKVSFECESDLFNEEDVVFTAKKVASTDVIEKTAIGYAASDFTYANKNIEVTFTVTDGSLEIVPAEYGIKTESATKTYDGQPLTNEEASVIGLIGTETATVSGTGTITEVGNTENTYGEVTWGTAKSTNYVHNEELDELGTLEVVIAAIEVTVTAEDVSVTYDGAEHTATKVSFECESDLFNEEDVIYTAKAQKSTDVIAKTAIGYSDADFTYANKNIEVTFTVTDGSLEIVPAEYGIKTESATKTYDGEPLTNANASVVGLIGEESATVSGTGTITEVGNTENTYGEVTWGTAKSTNYVHNEELDELGTLEVVIAEIAVTVTAEDVSVTYDGSEHTATEVTFECESDLFNEEDVIYTAKAQKSTDVIEKTAIGYAASDFTYANKNIEVTFTVTDGSLEIVPAEYGIKTESATKTYDGQPLTNASAAVVGLIGTETATVSGTGTITEVGNTDNTYGEVTWGTAKSTNYVHNEELDELGTLSVVIAAIEVTVTAEDISVTYDGEAHTATEVTFSSESSLFNEEDVIYTAKAQKSTDVIAKTAIGYTASDFSYANENIEVTFTVTDGSLEIVPAEYGIKTESATKTYDGEPLTNANASVVGLIGTETATVSGTGTITEVGNTENTYGEVTWGTAKSTNYVHNEELDELGTLTVAIAAIEVTVTAEDVSVTYDGSEHTATKVSFECESDLFNEEDVIYTAKAQKSTDVIEKTAIGYAASDFTYANENITVTFTVTDGSLEIVPAEYGIKTESATKTYDGEPLTNASASVVGLIGEETATVSGTGTITEVGTTDNTYGEVTWGTAKASNYTHNTALDEIGTLEVTIAAIEVTVTAEDISVTYDGAEHTATKVSFECESDLFNEEDVIYTAKDVTSTDVIEKTAIGYSDADFTYANGNITVTFTVTDGSLEIVPAEYGIKTESATKTYDGQPLTNASASVVGLIGTETATVSGTGTITGVGTIDNTYGEVTWGTAKASNYVHNEDLDELGTLTVAIAAIEVTVTAEDISVTYDGAEHTATKVSFECESDLFNEEDVIYTAKAQKSTDVIEKTAIGYSAADFTYANTNIEVTFTVTDGSLEIVPAEYGIKTESATKTYDGEPLTNASASVVGLIGTETATVSGTGTITEVGTTENTYGEVTWGTAKSTNYVHNEDLDELGTLTVAIAAIEVTVTAEDISLTYDGSEHTATKVTFSSESSLFNEDDVVFTAKKVASTDVIEKTAIGYSAADFTYANKNIEVTFTVTDGSLEIVPAEYGIKTESATKTYDGQPLTNANATVVGLIGNETATVSGTGTITEVGTTENTYGEVAWGTAKSTNYVHNEELDELGTLTVAIAAIEVTVTAEDISVTYDGAEHTATKVSFDCDSDLFNEDDVVFTAKKVASTDVIAKTAIGYAASDFSYANKNIEVTFTVTDGSLEIVPAEYGIKTESATKTYDGQPLTNANASVVGLIGSETATVSGTGTITEVGNTENTYGEVTWGTAKASNYVHNEELDELGTLTVAIAAIEVTVTAEDISVTYDGAEHTATKVSFECESDLFNEEDVVFTAKKVASTDVIEKTAIGYAASDFTYANKNIEVTFTVTDGSLEIVPAEYGIKTESATKTYDGQPLTNANAIVVGLIGEESATVSGTGTITEVGNTDNTYGEVTWDTAKASNYTHNTALDELGTLSVVIAAIEVTVTAEDVSVTYDGSEHTATKVSFECESDLFNEEDVIYTAKAQKSTDVIEKTAIGYTVSDFTYANTNIEVTFTVTDGSLEIVPAEYGIKTESATKTYDGQSLTNANASVVGLIGTETATVSGTGTITEVGNTENTYGEVTWGTAKASNYTHNTALDELGTLEVTIASIEVTVTAEDVSVTYDGAEHTATKVSFECESDLFNEEDVIYTAKAQKSTDVIEKTAIGYSDADFTYANKNIEVTFTVTDGSLEIVPAEYGIKTESATKTYDGQPLTNASASVVGLIGTETATVSGTGTITEVGTTDNTYGEVTWGTAKSTNYVHNEELDELGTLTVAIAAIEVTVTAEDVSVTYDGAEHTATKVSFECESDLFNEEDVIYTAKKVASTDVIEKTAIGYTASDFTYANKNIEVTFTVTDGSLEIVPAEYGIKTESATKTYDGQPLTNSAASVVGLIGTETATVSGTGTITEVGTTDNTYGEVTWGTAKASNYVHNEELDELGTLSVVIAAIEVTVTAEDVSVTYDGAEHTATKVSFESESDLFNEEDVIYTAKKVASTDVIAKTAIGYTASDFSYANTNIEVTFTVTDGSLEIVPAEYGIKTESATKTYDGQPLTNANASVLGLIGTETATVSGTGTITEVGNTENTYGEVTWGTAKAGNYTHNTALDEIGTLEVTIAAIEVTVTAEDVSVTYDGAEHTATEVTFECESDLFNEEDVIYTAKAQKSTDVIEKTAIGYAASDFSYANKNIEVTFTVTDGSLEIVPAEYGIKTESATKTYDGEPLTNEEASVIGLIGTETATVSGTGTITEVGNTENTYGEVTWGTAKSTNYVHNEELDELGTLTVAIAAIEVTVTAEDVSMTYDGAEHTATKVTFSSESSLFNEENVIYTAKAQKSTDVIEKTAIGYSEADFSYANKNIEVTFTVTDGSLEIVPAEYWIETEDATKTYDGTALTAAGAVKGLIGSETAEPVMTGMQTEAGSSSNSYNGVTWGTANAANYKHNAEKDVIGTLTVNKAEVAIDITGYTVTYDGETHTATSELTGELPEGYTYEITLKDDELTDAGESTAKVAEVKIYDETGKDVTENFTVDTTAEEPVKITAAEYWVETESAYKTYDGQPLTAPGSVKGLIGSETAEPVMTGTQTEAGSSSNSYNGVTWGTANAANYKHNAEKDVIGTLTVNKAEVAIDITGYTVTYDGDEHTATSELTGELPEGYTYEITLKDDALTDAGESTAKVAEVKIYDETGKDVTENFTVDKTAEEPVKITAAEYWVETEDATKTYDGTALTAAGAVKGLIGSETAEPVMTGTQTEAGSSSNSYNDVTWTTANAANYKHNAEKDVIGTLTVNKAEVAIDITGYTVTYDGETHNATSELTGELPEGYTYEITLKDDELTDAGESTAKVAEVKIYDETGKDVTENFTVDTTAEEPVKITAAEYWVETETASKTYDGTALTAAGAVKGLIGSETAEPVMTGTQTEAGSSSNSYNGVTWGTANAANYKHNAEKDVIGTLTVNKAEVAIDITGYTVTYDGETHTATSELTGELPEGYTYEITLKDDELTDAGESTAKVAEVKIYDETGKDVTENFTVDTTAEEPVKITAAEYWVETEDATKTYDGTALTAAGAVKGLIGSETAEPVMTGTQTEAGSSSNSYNGVTWTTANTANYKHNAEKDVIGTLTVNKAEVAIEITGYTVTYDGETHNATSELTGELPEGYTYEITLKDDELTDAGESTAKVAEVKIYDETGKDVTENFTVDKTAEEPVKIEKAEYWVETESAYKTYDGQPLTAPGSVKGLMDGEEAAPKMTGTQTAVGTSDNTYNGVTWTSAKAANYFHNAEKDVIGTLNVGLAVVTVEITGYTVSYDGDEHTATSELTGELPEGYTYKITLKDDALTDAGESTAKVDTVKVFDPSGKDVTEFFAIDKTAEEPVKIEKAEYWVETETASKTYDGQPLTAAGSVKGLMDGEEAAAVMTGTQTDAGTSDNTYSGVTWTTAKADNYFHNAEKDVIGTLTVDPLHITVTVTGHTAEFDYDGESHQVEGFDWTWAPDDPSVTVDPDLFPDDGFVYDGNTLVEATDVNRATPSDPVEGYPMELDPGLFRNLDDNFVVTFTVPDDGELIIQPIDAEVTVTENSGHENYTGAEYTVSGYLAKETDEPLYDVSSLEDIPTDAWTVTEANAGTYDLGILPEDFENTDPNFETVTVTVVDGTLVIDPKLVIRYWYTRAGGEQAADDIEYWAPAGSGKEFPSPSIKGWSADKKKVGWTAPAGNLTADESVTVIDVIYSHIVYRLTIRYVYDDGTTAAPTVSEDLFFGDHIHYDSPIIDGYQTNTPTVLRSMPAKDLTVTVIYTANEIYIPDYTTPLGAASSGVNVGDCIE